MMDHFALRRQQCSGAFSSLAPLVVMAPIHFSCLLWSFNILIFELLLLPSNAQTALNLPPLKVI